MRHLVALILLLLSIICSSHAFTVHTINFTIDFPPSTLCNVTATSCLNVPAVCQTRFQGAQQHLIVLSTGFRTRQLVHYQYHIENLLGETSQKLMICSFDRPNEIFNDGSRKKMVLYFVDYLFEQSPVKNKLKGNKFFSISFSSGGHEAYSLGLERASRVHTLFLYDPLACDVVNFAPLDLKPLALEVLLNQPSNTTMLFFGSNPNLVIAWLATTSPVLAPFYYNCSWMYAAKKVELNQISLENQARIAIFTHYGALHESGGVENSNLLHWPDNYIFYIYLRTLVNTIEIYLNEL